MCKCVADENGPLYHYCSVQTFYNIIKNKSIWLSDLSRTNDSKELIWLKEIIGVYLKTQKCPKRQEKDTKGFYHRK